MIISIKNCRNVIGTILVFYATNKFLFDYLFGAPIKSAYYMLIFIGAIFGIYELILDKEYGIVFSYSIYVIIISLNAFLIANLDQRKIGLIQYITFPLTMMALYYYFSGYTAWEKFISLYCKWGVVLSALAIYEYLSTNSILPSESTVTIFYDGTKAYRATVFQGSPLILGVVLGSVAIILFISYFKNKNRKHLLMSILVIAGSLATGSRGPLVATIVAIMVSCLLILNLNGLSRTYFVGLMISISILFVAIWILINFGSLISTGISVIDSIIHRFSSIVDFSNEWGNISRVRIWKYYITRFCEKPWVGYGIGSTSAMVSSNAHTRVGIVTESGLLAHMVETGIIGTLSYYYFFFCCIRKIKFMNSEKQLWKVIVIGVIIMFLIEDLVLQISMDLICTFVLWLSVAVGLSLENQKKQKMIKVKIFK